jgi:TRAP-type C4-dicarboxylate transport system permease large subunit
LRWLIGHRHGGLRYVAIVAAIVVASLSGSAAADTRHGGNPDPDDARSR